MYIFSLVTSLYVTVRDTANLSSGEPRAVVHYCTAVQNLAHLLSALCALCLLSLSVYLQTKSQAAGHQWLFYVIASASILHFLCRQK